MFIGLPQSATGGLLKRSDGGTHAAHGVRRHEAKEEAREVRAVLHIWSLLGHQGGSEACRDLRGP